MHRYFSPAKINLYLAVLGKREDGFHNLASLFQAVSLGDTLTYAFSKQDSLTSNDLSLDASSKNLIFRAAELFKKKTGLSFHLDVHLDKQIPKEGGLGGGSSNAATTLWALNELLDCKIPLEDLIDWSGELGSDVAFFFSNGTAYCTSRGEIVRPLPALSAHCTIVTPKYGVSTAQAFSLMDPSMYFSGDPEEVLQGFFNNKPCYFNNLENITFQIQAELASLKSSLLHAGFDTVLMTGSGSSFFCFGEGAISEIKDISVFQTQFLNRPDNSWYSALVF